MNLWKQRPLPKCTNNTKKKKVYSETYGQEDQPVEPGLGFNNERHVIEDDMETQINTLRMNKESRINRLRSSYMIINITKFQFFLTKSRKRGRKKIKNL